MLSKKKKILIISVIAVAVALNAVTLWLAYPETFKPESPTLARDFSAYYIGEWRLFHNPTQIYSGAPQPSDYQILPTPQTFKYAPSFLILFAPFLTLSYQDALVAFNVVQLALIPALAFFVYKIIKDKNLVLGAIAAIIVLIDPLPNPPINQSEIHLLQYRFTSLNSQTFSSSYYSGYVLANAHILQTTLIVGALYFGFAKKPWLSALFFAFSVFDPRVSLLAFPLLLWYNRQKILRFITGTVTFLAITNLPFFFYYNIGFTFLQTEVKGNIVSQMYAYDWIPIYSIAALTIIEIITIIAKNRRMLFSFLRIRKTENLETQNLRKA